MNQLNPLRDFSSYFWVPEGRWGLQEACSIALLLLVNLSVSMVSRLLVRTLKVVVASRTFFIKTFFFFFLERKWLFI